MKVLTSVPEIGRGLPDFFPCLEQYIDSKRVKICGHRPAPGAQFSYYNYDIIIIAVYGDYQGEHFKEIQALAKIRPGQQVIVTSSVELPAEFVMPKNVHWLTMQSMYAVYTKGNTYKEQVRPQIQKQFVSLNFRYTWFRQELFYYFYTNNLLANSYFSYACDDRFSQGHELLYKDAHSIIGDRYTNLDAMCDLIPYKNFNEVNVPKKIPHDVVNFMEIQQLYQTAGIAVETETYMEPFLDYNPGLTEKTIRPIILGNPFLIYSNRGTLKQLREMGFETYSSIIDESYDDILSPQHRFESILKEIGRLSKEDITVTLKSVEPIIEYNQHHMFTTLVDTLNEDNNLLDKLIKSLI